MRRISAAALVLAALAICATVTAAPNATRLTQARLLSSFKARTGTTLVVDRRASYSGHYVALGAPESIANVGRYGHFTIWVVTAAGADDSVNGLLVDPHTGTLGTPGPASIYWEHGTTAGGGGYWLAKKRYGANLVLWWYGTAPRIDASFRRLHRALLAITAPPA